MDEELLEKILRRKKTMYVGGGGFRRMSTVKQTLLNQVCSAIPCPFCLVEKEGGFPSEEAAFFQKVRDETEEVREQTNMRLSPLHYGHSLSRHARTRSFLKRILGNVGPFLGNKKKYIIREGKRYMMRPFHAFNCSKSEEKSIKFSKENNKHTLAKDKALNDPYTLWEQWLDLFEQCEYNLDLLIRRRGAQTEKSIFLEDGSNGGVTYFEENEIAGKLISKWMSPDEKVKIITHMKNQENSFLCGVFNGAVFNEFVDRRVI